MSSGGGGRSSSNQSVTRTMTVTADPFIPAAVPPATETALDVEQGPPEVTATGRVMNVLARLLYNADDRAEFISHILLSRQAATGDYSPALRDLLKILAEVAKDGLKIEGENNAYEVTGLAAMEDAPEGSRLHDVILMEVVKEISIKQEQHELKNRLQTNQREIVKRSNPKHKSIQGQAALIPVCEGNKTVDYRPRPLDTKTVVAIHSDGKGRGCTSGEIAIDESITLEHVGEFKTGLELGKENTQKIINIALRMGKNDAGQTHKSIRLPPHVETQLKAASLVPEQFRHALEQRLTSKISKKNYLKFKVEYMTRVGPMRDKVPMTVLNGEFVIEYSVTERDGSKTKVTVGVVARVLTENAFSEIVMVDLQADGRKPTVLNGELNFLITAKSDKESSPVIRVLPHNVSYMFEGATRGMEDITNSSYRRFQLGSDEMDGRAILYYRTLFTHDGKKYVIPELENRIRTTDPWSGLPRGPLDEYLRSQGKTHVDKIMSPIVACMDPESHRVLQGSHNRGMILISSTFLNYLKRMMRGDGNGDAPDVPIIRYVLGQLLDRGLVIGKADKLRATTAAANVINTALSMTNVVDGFNTDLLITRLAIALLTTKKTLFEGGITRPYSSLKPHDYQMQQLPVSFTWDGQVVVCPATHVLTHSFFKGMIKTPQSAAYHWANVEPKSVLSGPVLQPAVFVKTCLEKLTTEDVKDVSHCDSISHQTVLYMYGDVMSADRLIHDCALAILRLKERDTDTYAVYHHMFVILFSFRTDNRDLEVYVTGSGRPSRISKPLKNSFSHRELRQSDANESHRHVYNLHKDVIGYGTEDALTKYLANVVGAI